jgi:biopolymer transport protein ExbD
VNVAAADARPDDEDIISGINVTPLVDITLVLLIIFIVTAKLVVSHAVPHDLPRAATATETEVVFAVSVGADGRVSVDAHPIARDEELRDRALAAMRKDPDLRAVIQASGDARHAAVMRAMDVLRQAGVNKIGFAVDRIAPLEPAGSGPPR